MARPNGLKKNDWVLYAYIMENKGEDSVMSLRDLVAELSIFTGRDSRSRRISQMMARNKRFQRLEAYHNKEGVYVSIWKFTGELPKIPKRTLKDWDALLSLRESKPDLDVESFKGLSRNRTQ